MASSPPIKSPARVEAGPSPEPAPLIARAPVAVGEQSTSSAARDTQERAGIDGEPDGAAGADVAPAGRHRPPQGVQRVRLRQHDGDRHPRPPGRVAARADPAGVPRRVQPGPGPPHRLRAQRPPQARHAAVDPGPGRPRRHHPEAVPHRRRHRPPRRHRDHLLPHPVAAPDRPPRLPRPVRLLRRARRHRADLRRPPAAAAGVPCDPSRGRGGGGGPVAGGAGRPGALQGRGAAAGHRRARLHPRVQRAELGAPGGGGARLPPHVRPVAGAGGEGRDVGELRVRPPHRAPVRRQPGEVLRQGAPQGHEGARHQRLGAHPGGGDAGGGGHAVHQGRVPQDVQAIPRRRHPLRDVRQLPHLPALPRRTRPDLLNY